MKFYLFIIFSSFLFITAHSQDTVFIAGSAGGLEIQAYPTGIIPGLIWYGTLNQNNFIHARIGYNYVRHGSAGLHEDERGDGFGGSLGYDRQLRFGKMNWLLGVRCDLWQNKLKWKNNIGGPAETSGVSKVTVVQPTLRISYPLNVGSSFIIPALAFGSEINVKTKGDNVGEGFILLLGLSYILQ
jgi:hypothetical protein